VPLIEEEDLPKSDENEPKNGGGSQNVVGLLPGDHLYDQEEADHPNPDDPYSQRLAAKLFAAAEGTEAHKDSKETDANKKPIHRLYFTLCPSAGTFTNLRLQISGVTR
jgi:hypothetical protein